MRCESIQVIGQTIDLNGVDAKIISAGPLDQKTGTYDLIVKVKVSKELLDAFIKNVLESK